MRSFNLESVVGQGGVCLCKHAIRSVAWVTRQVNEAIKVNSLHNSNLVSE